MPPRILINGELKFTPHKKKTDLKINSFSLPKVRKKFWQDVLSSHKLVELGYQEFPFSFSFGPHVYEITNVNQ